MAALRALATAAVIGRHEHKRRALDFVPRSLDIEISYGVLLLLPASGRRSVRTYVLYVRALLSTARQGELFDWSTVEEQEDRIVFFF